MPLDFRHPCLQVWPSAGEMVGKGDVSYCVGLKECETAFHKLTDPGEGTGWYADSASSNSTWCNWCFTFSSSGFYILFFNSASGYFGQLSHLLM